MTIHLRHRSAALAALVLIAAACQGDGDESIRDLDPVATPAPETTATSEPATPSTTDGTNPTVPAPETTVATDATAPAADATAPASTSTVPPVLDPPPTTRPAPASVATETVYPVGSIDPGLTPFIEIATVDLAERLAVSSADIEVLTAVLVTWPDASAGCPEPDRAYAQVVTDGSVIELGVDGAVYRYHSGGSLPPFPCDVPLDPAPPALG